MRMKTTHKRATNLSLATHVVDEARELGLNLSQACERGLVLEIAAKRRERWLQENLSSIEAWNKLIDENKMPLAEFRQL
jgi:antitoxin CcdA